MLDNLDDPVTKQNLALMRPEQRTLIERFLKVRELPEQLGAEFLDAVREAMAGLSKVEICVAELRATLLGDGAPARLDDIQQRFQSYLDGLVRGKDRNKVRVVVE